MVSNNIAPACNVATAIVLLHSSKQHCTVLSMCWCTTHSASSSSTRYTRPADSCGAKVCGHVCLTDSSEQTAGPGESPLATLGRIRTFAPTAAKLAESSGEYLSTIKARRQEEVVARREREVRTQPMHTTGMGQQ